MGLRNDLTYALSEHDDEKACMVISSSIFVLGVVVIVLIPLGAAVSVLVDWNAVLAVDKGELGADDLAARHDYRYCGDSSPAYPEACELPALRGSKECGTCLALARI